MADSTEFTEFDDHSEAGASILGRPQFQLRSLPIRFRWEATRRHPYYQQWWRVSQDYHRNEPIIHPGETLLRTGAVTLLGSIGVSGEPPDPATSFDDLEAENLNSAWLSGAVHPISLRGIAGLLIAALPKETAGYVGMLLVEASCDDKEDEPPQMNKALMDLAKLDKPGLNEILDEPIVSVNPAASARQVSEAVAELQKNWKAQRNLGERRDRSDKYQDYLRIWDLREGWNNGVYDRTRERRLVDIASELKMSVTSVHNHYRSAFELIVGRPYSPELWYQVFGLLKISEWYGAEIGPVARRRPSISPTRRDVPEAVVSPSLQEGHTEGLIASAPSFSDDFDLAEVAIEIRRLVGQGLTDKEIVGELDMSDAAIPVVAYLRERGDEPTG